MLIDVVSSELFFTFVATCIIIELTPGPNMIYLAILSVSEGRRAGFEAVAGAALGLTVIGVAAALGLAAVISNSPFLYHALRWGGILYLLWLAYDGWMSAAETSVLRAEATSPPLKSHFKYFNRGLLTNLLNPKAGLFYVAVLPGFVLNSHPIASQLIILSLIFVAIATTIHFLIVSLAGTARVLLEDPKRNRLVRRGLSLLLLLVVIWFSWSTRNF